MAKFIELTNSGSRSKMSINVDNISFIAKTSDGCAAIYFGESCPQTTEAYDEVIALLSKTTTSVNNKE